MAHPDAIDLASLPLPDLLSKRRGLRRRLLQRPDLHPIRIAILAGSTPNELADLLELQLLAAGFHPTFHLTGYGRFHTDAVHDPAALIAFRPDLVYVHTSVLNLQLPASEADHPAALEHEFARFHQIWSALEQNLACLILQNNFELPEHALLGNLEPTHGCTRFLLELNRRFAEAARANPRLILNDAFGISARLGLAHWFDPQRFFLYKIVTTPAGSQALALSLAALIRAAFGRTRKVLVLDLDNTLWGGVIGDDGADRIQIGQETPVAEAYAAFQRYCLALRARGVLLAVCSKNDDAIARSGFAHPDSILRLEHFSAFAANWEPKPDNLRRIAQELNLGLESFVFVDDNPAERDLVSAQLPEVAVPDVGADVAAYPAILDHARYFEQLSLSAEDLTRAQLYQADTTRTAHAGQFSSYGDYLDSLEMHAEIAPFKPVYLDRIAQLTNKTNQFNLTTRRYTLAELEAAMHDPSAVHLYGRLSDRFGDNGLVSVILARRAGSVLDIDLWLMSCRVLKRDLEHAMLDALVDHALALGIRTLRGHYVPTRKNALVADHYTSLGFTPDSASTEGSRIYTLPLANYTPRNRHIHAPAEALTR